jgi:hypothetical protein
MTIYKRKKPLTTCQIPYWDNRNNQIPISNQYEI